MKEFDLEKAKAGAPVCTRCGRPARIIFWDANAKCDDYRFPIVALIDDDVDGEVAQTYATDGRAYPKETCDDDLMMAGIKHEGWVNVCLNEHGVAVAGNWIFDDEKLARNAALGDKRYIATAKIEWEE